MPLLKPGDAFPVLTFPQVGGGSFTIPDVFDAAYGVVLFYRGSWCPYCNGQLRAFQRATDSLNNEDAIVVALSVDDGPTSTELVAKHGLTFPVGHSADALAVSAATGAFVDPVPGLPPVNRVRARPRRPGSGERVLVGGHRPARARRRPRAYSLLA